MNKPQKNFNIMALRGADDVDDMDVCDTLGLDPNLAYTPAINDAAIKAMYKQNYDGWIAAGLSPAEAEQRATNSADEVRNEIKSRLG